jgi:hypothetical protein
VLPDLLLLLALPVLWLCLNADWFFTPAGTTDPWLYHGYFRRLRFLLTELLPDTYYGSRLPWILPGRLLYRALPPLLAHAALHLGVYYTAVFAVYYVLRCAVGRRTALLTAAFLGSHFYFLKAVGWDYVDGAAIAYSAAAVALVTRAARSGRPGAWLVSAGAFFASAVVLYPTLLLAAPLVGLYYLAAENCFRAPPGPALLLRGIACCVLGAAGLVLLLGMVNFRLGGKFWFFMPTVRFVLDWSQVENPWYRPLAAYIGEARWLVVPVLTVLGGLAFLLRRRRGAGAHRWELDVFLVLQALAVFLAFFFLELRGEGYFQNVHHTSLMMAFLVLGLGSSFLRVPEELSRGGFVIILASLLVLSAVPLVRVPPWVVPWSQPVRLVLVGSFGLLGISARFSLRRGLPALGMGMAGLFLAYLAAFPAFPAALPGETRHDHRAVFFRIDAALQALKEVAAERKPYFWYSKNEEHGAEFTSLAATHGWLSSLINDSFPGLKRLDNLGFALTEEDYHALEQGQLIVLLSSEPEPFQRAEAALRPTGHRLRRIAERTIRQPDGWYTMTFCEVDACSAVLGVQYDGESPTGTLIPQGADAPLPLNLWTPDVPDSAETLQFRADGSLLVTTAASKFAYAAWYAPLTVTEDGTYGFCLKYRVLSGQFAFGALPADESKWIAQAPRSRVKGPGILSFRVPLRAGDQVKLLLTNCCPRSSRFVVEELRAYRIDCPASERPAGTAAPHSPEEKR